jgi:putative heme-binding domain-containing protein
LEKEEKKSAHDEPVLLTAHRYRLKTAKAEWERKHEGQRERVKEVEEVRKIDGDPQFNRAVADWMTAVPKAENLPELLGNLDRVPAEDTHLHHALRIALRETLRDPAAITALKAMKLDDKTLRAVADVFTGLPTKDAADYLTANLAALAGDTNRLPIYVEHACRYGDGSKAIFAFVSTHKPDNLRLTVALFHAYQRGLQQKGGTRFDKADYDFADALVAKGLKDGDGQAVQSCLDLAIAFRLKSSAETIREFAVRKERSDAQRATAFSALLAVDPTQGTPVVGRILNDADERVEVRERAAQALAALGGAPAYVELMPALEKSPARVQTSIAIALAGTQPGATQLLNAVATGKASARLLQERAVIARLNESKLPEVAERVAELTKGLPSADQKMMELMNQRRAGFAKAKPDAALGAAVYKTNCANCHQLGGEGAKIGPQLDGLGIRGLDRLLEDILDPSRNVDQAMRSTTLNLKDGKTVSGLVLREEGEVIVVADSLGKEVRVSKNDVDDRRTSLLSPMPANLAETIKEADFHNLMAFLLQQRPKDK